LARQSLRRGHTPLGKFWRSGGDEAADLKQAKDMDHTIASEFAGYGVNECAP
jgi:hypothetical protein